jgi:hypothetical protein
MEINQLKELHWRKSTNNLFQLAYINYTPMAAFHLQKLVVDKGADPSSKI